MGKRSNFEQEKLMTFMDSPLSTSDKDRFWSKVDIKSQDECWNWQGCLHRLGYGHFKVGGKRGKVALAHRFAMAVSLDDFDESNHCLHKCDNRKCCNPNHLWVGNHDDNMRDAAIKMRNRTPRIGNGHTKIQPELYVEIDNLAKSGVSKSEIGRRYGVTPTNIRHILKKVGYGQTI